jgi:hypothetical protein
MTKCLCGACTASPATSYSEDYRCQCEARYVAALPDLASRRAYLKAIGEKRGPKSLAVLELALREAWARR